MMLTTNGSNLDMTWVTANSEEVYGKSAGFTRQKAGGRRNPASFAPVPTLERGRRRPSRGLGADAVRWGHRWDTHGKGTHTHARNRAP